MILYFIEVSTTFNNLFEEAVTTKSRIKFLLVTVFILLFTLTGCGDTSQPTDSSNTTKSTTNQTDQSKTQQQTKPQGQTQSKVQTQPQAQSPAPVAVQSTQQVQSQAVAPTTVQQTSTSAPSGVETTPAADPQGETVYITRTGHKYHRAGCRYLARSEIPISLAQAKAEGYTPCSVCDPPQ